MLLEMLEQRLSTLPSSTAKIWGTMTCLSLVLLICSILSGLEWMGWIAIVLFLLVMAWFVLLVVCLNILLLIQTVLGMPGFLRILPRFPQHIKRAFVQRHEKDDFGSLLVLTGLGSGVMGVLVSGVQLLRGSSWADPLLLGSGFFALFLFFVGMWYVDRSEEPKKKD